MTSPLLSQIPQDIFRVIFQYLSIRELIEAEQAFLNNQAVLTFFHSSLVGHAVRDLMKFDTEILIPWIIDHKVLLETFVFSDLEENELNLSETFRPYLKTVLIRYLTASTGLVRLGCFPSLTSASFDSFKFVRDDDLVFFLSRHPNLEILSIVNMEHLTNDIFLQISNYCPHIRMLTLSWNDWVNNETMSILTQGFPNLKALDIRETAVRDENVLRRFILSRPQMYGLWLPYNSPFSSDFYLFYLKQLIFPSLLSRNRESHAKAVASLRVCFDRNAFDGRHDVVNPEIFTPEILMNLHPKWCSFDTQHLAFEIILTLKNFPSMSDLVKQLFLDPVVLHSLNPFDFKPPDVIQLLFTYYQFSEAFPILIEKYQSRPSVLILIYWRAYEKRYSLTREESQRMVPVVLSELQHGTDMSYLCLEILIRLFQNPNTQDLVDSNEFLVAMHSFVYNSNYSGPMTSITTCLQLFLTLNDQNQSLLINANILHGIMKMKIIRWMLVGGVVKFSNDCLLSPQHELLVEHLVESGLFEFLVVTYEAEDPQTEDLFKLFLEFKERKYFKIVREMELPRELRSSLFENRDETK